MARKNGETVTCSLCKSVENEGLGRGRKRRGGESTHRFDHGRGDVKNNERGRGQERGCNLPFPPRYYHYSISVI